MSSSLLTAEEEKKRGFCPSSERRSVLLLPRLEKNFTMKRALHLHQHQRPPSSPGLLRLLFLSLSSRNAPACLRERGREMRRVVRAAALSALAGVDSLDFWLGERMPPASRQQSCGCRKGSTFAARRLHKVGGLC